MIELFSLSNCSLNKTKAETKAEAKAKAKAKEEQKEGIIID